MLHSASGTACTPLALAIATRSSSSADSPAARTCWPAPAAVDELRLERRRDQDRHVLHGVVLSIPGTIRRVDREVLYEGKMFDVSRRDGREVVEHGPAVSVVPVSDGHVTLVRQERVPA